MNIRMYLLISVYIRVTGLTIKIYKNEKGLYYFTTGAVIDQPSMIYLLLLANLIIILMRLNTNTMKK